jgi:hypothetical protein
MDLMKEYWNSGTMEYWVKEKHFHIIPVFQHSSIPGFSIPSFLFS